MSKKAEEQPKPGDLVAPVQGWYIGKGSGEHLGRTLASSALYINKTDDGHVVLMDERVVNLAKTQMNPLNPVPMRNLRVKVTGSAPQRSVVKVSRCSSLPRTVTRCKSNYLFGSYAHASIPSGTLRSTPGWMTIRLTGQRLNFAWTRSWKAPRRCLGEKPLKDVLGSTHVAFSRICRILALFYFLGRD